MGLTHFDARIRNPAAPERSWQGSSLVDTGAIASLVPRPTWRPSACTPSGRACTRPSTIVRSRWTSPAVIIFGDAKAEPLIGVTALESVGVEVDPVNQRLRKLPSIRLKGIRYSP